MDKRIKKTLYVIGFSGLVIAGGLVLFAYSNSWNKTEIEFRIHINQELVLQSAFGEPPTFAIWMEDRESGKPQTVFVTRRAASGDWEGKANVPVALPVWFEVYKKENLTDNLPTFEKPAPMAVTGATPKPGYFTTRVRVPKGSRWIGYIEVNLAGDFNEYYPEFDDKQKVSDTFLTGQPALLYKAEIPAQTGLKVKPELIGMAAPDTSNKNLLQPVKGITTASDIFDQIEISVVNARPKIID